MFDKPQSSQVLGLDLDAFSLKGAALSFVRGAVRIDSLFDYPVETSVEIDGIVKPLYTAEQKAALDALSDDYLVVTTAATRDVLIRPLELRLTKDKDIDAALIFQVETILPYPTENAVVDKLLLSKNKEGSKLTILAIRKDHLKQQVEMWKNLEIEPEVISAAPQALTLFTRQYLGKMTPLYVLHLGIDNSFCILMDEGKLITAQAIPEGLNSFINLLAQERGIDQKTAFEELVKINFNIPHSNDTSFKTCLDAFRMSITRTIYSIGKQMKGREVNEIFVTGFGASVEGLVNTLCAPLNKTRLFLPETLGNETPHDELLAYALPIGEALSAFPSSRDQINFRQQEFSYPEPWKRLKHPLMQYIALCVAVAISLFIFGKAYVGYKAGEVKRQYIELLDMMNKPYNDFEREYAGKTSSIEGTNSEQIVSVKKLSSEEIQYRLDFLEKEIQATPQIFPLYPNVPLVSDVLAWITSHPVFLNNKEAVEGGEAGTLASTEDLLHIDSFTYTMIKRPEPTKKQEKYQIKIDLEFSSSIPKKAREFHDALIAPNDLVDPKGEIKWSSNRDRYRTSFYLKDKTVYSNN
ncbi:MAG: hypothetical protein WCF65_03060 [Parachlamydiaceae bacterium]